MGYAGVKGASSIVLGEIVKTPLLLKVGAIGLTVTLASTYALAYPPAAACVALMVVEPTASIVTTLLDTDTTPVEPTTEYVNAPGLLPLEDGCGNVNVPTPPETKSYVNDGPKLLNTIGVATKLFTKAGVEILVSPP